MGTEKDRALGLFKVQWLRAVELLAHRQLEADVARSFALRVGGGAIGWTTKNRPSWFAAKARQRHGRKAQALQVHAPP